MHTIHESVLSKEVITLLKPKAGETLLDGTVGGGGHALALAEEVVGKLTVIGIDLDSAALKRVDGRFKEALPETKLILKQGNFREMDSILSELGVDGVDMILLDLGYSSDQLAEARRGLSFQNEDEPLSLQLTDTPSESEFTAADILNSWGEESIANVLFGYGEERAARRLAKAIVAHRVDKQFVTVGDLVEVVEGVLPRRGRTSPATKTWQALRIAVNDELQVLEAGIQKAYQLLNPGGRLAIISFHSLEDRIIKQAFKALASEAGAELLTKKPLAPEPEEVRHNPRSRSAKIRAIKKPLTS